MNSIIYNNFSNIYLLNSDKIINKNTDNLFFCILINRNYFINLKYYLTFRIPVSTIDQKVIYRVKFIIKQAIDSNKDLSIAV